MPSHLEDGFNTRFWTTSTILRSPHSRKMAYTNPHSKQLSLNIPPGRDTNGFGSVPVDHWVLLDASAGSSTLEANPGYDQVRKAFHHGEEIYQPLALPPFLHVDTSALFFGSGGSTARCPGPRGKRSPVSQLCAAPRHRRASHHAKHHRGQPKSKSYY